MADQPVRMLPSLSVSGLWRNRGPAGEAWPAFPRKPVPYKELPLLGGRRKKNTATSFPSPPAGEGNKGCVPARGASRDGGKGTIALARRRGRDVFFEALRQEGVDHLFGNPGTTELPLMDGLPFQTDVRYILCLHEDVAVGAAMGYAASTGKVGVVNLHVAPG